MFLKSILKKMKNSGHKKNITDEEQSISTEVYDAFVNADFSPDSEDNAAGADENRNYFIPVSEISQNCLKLSSAETEYELLKLIAKEVKKYSLKDLQDMKSGFAAKIKDLDEGYRDKLLLKVNEQIFDAHHELIIADRDPDKYFGNRNENPENPPVSESGRYFMMAGEACREKAKVKDPKFTYLKFLLAGFTMIIEKKPAHPAGTPFPGGQIVDEWEGTYYCPVRDMADDVLYALCPFCPAKQSDEPLYPETKLIRKKRQKQESLQNYWTNYKG